jgi:hypothetical protein
MNKTMACLFGNRSTLAICNSANTLLCPLPVSTHPGSFPFSLSIISGAIITSSFYFKYDSSISVSDIHPRIIRAKSINDVLVRVKGYGFGDFDDAICKFGLVSQPLLFESYTDISCVVPPILVPGPMTLSISMDGLNFIKAGAIIVEADMTLLSIYPEQGPEIGSTDAIITTSGFSNSSQLECLVGKLSVQAELQEDGVRLKCKMPQGKLGGGIESVSVRGWSTSLIAINNLFYYYIPSIQLKTIFPMNLFTNQQSYITISLLTPYLGMLRDTMHIQCRFGDDVKTISNAVEINKMENLIICKTPTIASSGLLEVYLTFNKIDFNKLPINMYVFDQPEVLRVEPNIIEVSTNNRIMIHGNKFISLFFF